MKQTRTLKIHHMMQERAEKFDFSLKLIPVSYSLFGT
jgi:hypothetical protein